MEHTHITASLTNSIEHKELELQEIRRDMGGISPNLSLWLKLQSRAVNVEGEIKRLVAIRAQTAVAQKHAS